MAGTKKRTCLEHPDRKATVGSYCNQCMSNHKRSRKEQAQREAYAQAVQAGAGDLWRLNY